MKEKETTAQTPDWWERDEQAEKWQIGDYCKATIKDFDKLEREVLHIVEERSCSLSSASWELWCKINDAIRDYCEEYGMNAEDYDAEEIFWDYI